jgi:Fic family protein
MALHWVTFDFNYVLDVSRLLPHIAAIETRQEAASSRVIPPQWREQPVAIEPHSAPPADPRQIDVRKGLLQSRNESRAHAWVKQRFPPSRPPISIEDILTMHRMVAEEAGVRGSDAGAWRSSGFPVYVGRREVGIHFGAPEDKLPALMDRYVRFVGADILHNLPAVIHALVAHFFFTTIHPFDDGNGRVSRLVAAAILFQRGYNGHGLHALSAHFYQRDMKYHTLLHQCWRQPLPFDLTEFVAFGIEGLATELQGIESFIKIKLHRSDSLRIESETEYGRA